MSSDDRTGLEIAIIGWAGRFPGATSVERLWRRLAAGEECIEELSEERILAAGADPAEVRDPAYVRRAAIVSDADRFDALLFGYTPRAAETMDPQQRVFLECAWTALEDAGYGDAGRRRPVGVYAGAGQNTYLLDHLHGSDAIDSAQSVHTVMGNTSDFLATRVSYKLDLDGPAVAIQSSCSTSLVAIHLACQALIAGECDLALAGGVSILSRQDRGYLPQPDGIYSPDGHCRAFDAAAAGTVGGNGAAAVVLKRLDQAEADGDSIRAVIRGSAVNNDGADKVGFTAPSVSGQAACIAAAHDFAEITADSIGYVEAHGTGTTLGDPIEIEALTEAFRRTSQRDGHCAIGSIKTNLGHLDAAAGAAGLIKAALALERELIPPSLNYQRPNPAIDFAASPFVVAAEARPWPRGEAPRRAGVSAFGMGGTNAHAVLEEAPLRDPGDASDDAPQLLLLSARTEAALATATAGLADHLEAHPEQDLGDVAWTLQVGRTSFPCRRSLVAASRDDAIAALRGGGPGRRLDDARHDPSRAAAARVAFLFPGQGSQHPGMARELYAGDGLYRELVDRQAAILEPHLGRDLRPLLHPAPGAEAEAAEALRQTALTQPALFVVEYALARWWMQHGVTPDAMLGHSIGEYTAACLAGVFGLDDALGLIATRGRLMQELPPGSMLAVPLAAGELTRYLGDDGRLTVAVINQPGLCVVSGDDGAITELEAALARDDSGGRRLHTSHAFHSPMMDPILERFTAAVAAVERSAPAIAFVSNRTGTWITAAEATSPEYWAEHLRHTVHFADGVGTLLEADGRVLLEVGPGNTLSGLVRRHPEAARARAVIASLPHPREERPADHAALAAAGQLWAAGCAPDWASLHPRRRRRVPLPTYPFERQRYWIEPTAERSPVAASDDPARPRADLADWFHVPSWTRAPRPLADAAATRRWLLLGDEPIVGGVADILGQRGQRVRVATTSEVDPTKPEAIARLLDELAGDDATPDVIAHLWCAEGEASVERDRDRGYLALLHLAQALGGRNDATPVEIVVVTAGLCTVTGGERQAPSRALVTGPARVIPQEYPQIRVRQIDRPLGAGGDDLATLCDELVAGDPELGLIALRGAHRWRQGWEPLRIEASESSTPALGDGGVYLLTGGLGGVGLAIAHNLARTRGARLVLVGRDGLPPRKEWDAILASDDDGGARQRRRIAAVRAIEESGGEVVVEAADVADEARMREVFTAAAERFGEIDAVIHSAGVGGGGVIERQSATTMAATSRPKVDGTLVIDRVTAEHGTPLVVLCSSLLAVHGYPGRVEYTSANAFLDAMAEARAAGGRRWLAIDWDNWREVGMGVDYLGGDVGKGMTTEQGVEAFHRALRASEPRVAVSMADVRIPLGERREGVEATVDDVGGSGDETAAPAVTPGRHPRPALDEIYVAPRPGAEETLAAVWADALGIDRVGRDDNFFDLGGDSVLSLQIVSRARKRGVAISSRLMFDHQTVAALAEATGATTSKAAAATPPTPAPPATGAVLLTPIQRWFFAQDQADAHHFNLPAVLEARESFDLHLLEPMLRALVSHHEALRMRYREDEEAPGGWRQEIGEVTDAVACTELDLSGMGEAAAAETLRRAAAEAQAGLQLSRGPMLRAELFHRGEGKHDVLLLVVHHLLIDVVSWRIVIEDLNTLYDRLSRGEAPTLPACTTSYQDWARRLDELARSSQLEDERDHWRHLATSPPPPLPRQADGPCLFGQARSIDIQLSEAETRALVEDAPRAHEARIDEVLLAALGRALGDWTGERSLLVSLEHHGREDLFDADVDLTRTVGWFTNLYPVRFELPDDQAADVAAIKRGLRAVPRRGMGHGLLRWLRGDDEMSRLPTPEVAFLYHGRVDAGAASEKSALAPTADPGLGLGPAASPRTVRQHDLDFIGAIEAGRLRFELLYDAVRHDAATMRTLLESFAAGLRRLATLEPAAADPDAFIGARMSADALAAVMKRLSKPKS